MKLLIVMALLASQAIAAIPKKKSHPFTGNPQAPIYNQIKMLASNQVPITESLIEVGAQKYHTVEYQGLLFYFHLRNEEKISHDFGLLCRQYTVAALEKIPHKIFDTKVTSVAQVFVENLKNRCQKVDHFVDTRLAFPPKLKTKKFDEKTAYNPFEEVLGFKSDF